MILLIVFSSCSLVCSSIIVWGPPRISVNAVATFALLGVVFDSLSCLSAIVFFSTYSSQITTSYYGYGFGFGPACFVLALLSACLGATSRWGRLREACRCKTGSTEPEASLKSANASAESARIDSSKNVEGVA